MIHVPNSAPARVLSFVRQNERDKVFTVLNFSDQPRIVTFHESLYYRTYTDYFDGGSVELDSATQLILQPWWYRVFET